MTFSPATKAMPKEMLTVVDRPIIQHVAGFLCDLNHLVEAMQMINRPIVSIITTDLVQI